MTGANISKDLGLQKLIQRFPRLFRGAQPAVWSHVPGGWAEIVETLFGGIDALLSDEQAKCFRVEQIKEKFGMLRVYVSFDRVDAEGVNPDPTVLRALVDAAVVASAVTCYVCRASGQMRTLGGWATVRCGAHATREFNEEPVRIGLAPKLLERRPKQIGFIEPSGDGETLVPSAKRGMCPNTVPVARYSDRPSAVDGAERESVVPSDAVRRRWRSRTRPAVATGGTGGCVDQGRQRHSCIGASAISTSSAECPRRGDGRMHLTGCRCRSDETRPHGALDGMLSYAANSSQSVGKAHRGTSANHEFAAHVSHFSNIFGHAWRPPSIMSEYVPRRLKSSG